MKIEYNNKTSIAITKNSTYNSKGKYIDVKYHFVREMEKIGFVKLAKCKAKDNITNTITNVVNGYIFVLCRDIHDGYET